MSIILFFRNKNQPEAFKQPYTKKSQIKHLQHISIKCTNLFQNIVYFSNICLKLKCLSLLWLRRFQRNMNCQQFVATVNMSAHVVCMQTNIYSNLLGCIHSVLSFIYLSIHKICMHLSSPSSYSQLSFKVVERVNINIEVFFLSSYIKGTGRQRK